MHATDLMTTIELRTRINKFYNERKSESTFKPIKNSSSAALLHANDLVEAMLVTDCNSN